MRLSITVCALLAVGIVSPWGAAVAQDKNLGPDAPAAAESKNLGPDAPAAAEKRYLIARDLYKAGRYAEAASEFAVAFEMVPTSAKLAYNLGRCQERAGQPEPAAASFAQYLRLAPGAADRKEVEATIAALRRRIEATLPELVITSAPEGAHVTIGAQVPLPQPTPVTVRVPAGDHVVRFELEGYRARMETVKVAAGQSNAAHVTLARVAVTESELTAATGVAAAPQPIAPADDWRPVAGWTAVGVGAAGVALGAVYAVLATDTRDTLDGLGARDWRRYDGLNDDFGRQKTVAWAGLIGGAVLAGAGAALLLWPVDDAASVAVRPTPNGIVGVLRW